MHELELKWIKLLQTPHPLGLNENINHEGNIILKFFSLLDIRNALMNLMVNAKMEI